MANVDTLPIGRASAVIPSGLVFEGVGRRFGRKRALHDVSFEIKPGEVLCLLGPSGCGKSTLLRLIAGIDEPTSGRILMDGQEISGPDRFVQPEMRGIGLVFQDYALFPHLDALDNVMFGLRELPRPQRQEVAEVALRRVGLSAFADAFPDMLSGGEQQRVALARAVVARPRVLLMDEPFSNLDKRMRDMVREATITLLRETGATSVIVTHDPEEAMRIADRIVLMRDGGIVQVGSARELYRNPADLHAARFFCEINELQGVVSKGRVATPVGCFAAPELEDGTEVAVCVRPQGIYIEGPGAGIPARILQRRFIGPVDHFEIAVGGMEVPLVARIRNAPPFERGMDIGLSVDPAEVLVFRAARP
ncbi:MAG: ABC transporter ATP-binding protein [Proteobacteria bacterium]|nr:ABC transporter ATP-binding protein [Pseudomonadota bacterium]